MLLLPTLFILFSSGTNEIEVVSEYLTFYVNGNADKMKYLQLCRFTSHKEQPIEIYALYLSSKLNIERTYWFSDPTASMQFIEL